MGRTIQGGERALSSAGGEGRDAGMRRLLISLTVLAVVCAGAAWWQRAALERWWQTGNLLAEGTAEAVQRTPDPERYAVLSSELERWRLQLAGRHAAAGTGAERAAVEADARLLLERALPELMRCWLGTPWDFDGTSDTPGEGGIACGYFVATVLRDAGFKLDRYRLAQQPSENILRSFLPREACRLTVGQDYEAFAAGLAVAERGIYVVGLDTHVGFVVVEEEGGFRFIHSSGSRPWCVVDEDLDSAAVLRRSHWRMLGHLTGDEAVIRRWLSAERIAVRGA
jgi:hypothetical protein